MRKRADEGAGGWRENAARGEIVGEMRRDMDEGALDGWDNAHVRWDGGPRSANDAVPSRTDGAQAGWDGDRRTGALALSSRALSAPLRRDGEPRGARGVGVVVAPCGDEDLLARSAQLRWDGGDWGEEVTIPCWDSVALITLRWELRGAKVSGVA